jgi:hypothetical protein
MEKELFAELMGSMKEALEHARGKRALRTTLKQRRKPMAKKFRDLTAATMSKKSLKRAAARTKAMLAKLRA